MQMDIDQLYDILKNSQEPKGYFFNKDREKVYALLKGLLTNKERYGYMSCPCRLASGKYEQDKDIVCPCTYRAPDVEEFGSCYCSLYVSPGWNEGNIAHAYIPERRPPEKMPF
jgi:ferredoxin-thioredoxin reductase catalytic chain